MIRLFGEKLSAFSDQPSGPLQNGIRKVSVSGFLQSPIESASRRIRPTES
jgi:hypothetical protein